MEQAESALQEREERVSTTEVSLQEKASFLRQQELDLASLEASLNEDRDSLEASQRALKDAQAHLSTKQAELEEVQAEANHRAAQLEERHQDIENAARELEERQRSLENLIEIAEADKLASASMFESMQMEFGGAEDQLRSQKEQLTKQKDHVLDKEVQLKQLQLSMRKELEKLSSLRNLVGNAEVLKQEISFHMTAMQQKEKDLNAKAEKLEKEGLHLDELRSALERQKHASEKERAEVEMLAGDVRERERVATEKLLAAEVLDRKCASTLANCQVDQEQIEKERQKLALDKCDLERRNSEVSRGEASLKKTKSALEEKLAVVEGVWSKVDKQVEELTAAVTVDDHARPSLDVEHFIQVGANQQKKISSWLHELVNVAPGELLAVGTCLKEDFNLWKHSLDMREIACRESARAMEELQTGQKDLLAHQRAIEEVKLGSDQEVVRLSKLEAQLNSQSVELEKQTKNLHLMQEVCVKREEELLRVEQELKERESSLVQLSTQIQLREDDLDSKQAALEEADRRTQEKIDMLEEEKRQLARMKQEESCLFEEKNELMTQKEQVLSQKLLDVEQVLELKERLEMEQKEMAVLQKGMDKEQETLESVKAEISRRLDEVAEKETVVRDLELETLQRMEDVQKELKQEESKFSDVRLRVEMHEKELEVVLYQLQEAKEDVEKLKGKAQEFAAEASEAKRIHSQLEVDCRTKERELENCTSELEHTKSLVNEAKHELLELQKEAVHLKENFEAEYQSYQQYKSELEALEQDILDRERCLASQQTEMSSRELELEEARKQLETGELLIEKQVEYVKSLQQEKEEWIAGQKDREKLEHQLLEREKDLSEKKSALQEEKKALMQEQKAIADEKCRLKAQSENLEEAERSIAFQERDVAEKMLEVSKEAEDVHNRLSLHEKELQELQQRQTALQAEQEQVAAEKANVQSHLNEQQDQLREKLQELEEKERLVSEAEDSCRCKEIELANREQAVHLREEKFNFLQHLLKGHQIKDGLVEVSKTSHPPSSEGCDENMAKQMASVTEVSDLPGQREHLELLGPPSFSSSENNQDSEVVAQLLFTMEESTKRMSQRLGRVQAVVQKVTEDPVSDVDDAIVSIVNEVSALEELLASILREEQTMSKNIKKPDVSFDAVLKDISNMQQQHAAWECRMKSVLQQLSRVRSGG
eukprot:scaffold207_cov345-Pavlova_lutheri.AAC.1